MLKQCHLYGIKCNQSINSKYIVFPDELNGNK